AANVFVWVFADFPVEATAAVVAAVVFALVTTDVRMIAEVYGEAYLYQSAGVDVLFHAPGDIRHRGSPPERERGPNIPGCGYLRPLDHSQSPGYRRALPGSC